MEKKPVKQLPTLTSLGFFYVDGNHHFNKDEWMVQKVEWIEQAARIFDEKRLFSLFDPHGNHIESFTSLEEMAQTYGLTFERLQPYRKWRDQFVEQCLMIRADSYAVKEYEALTEESVNWWASHYKVRAIELNVEKMKTIGPHWGVLERLFKSLDIEIIDTGDKDEPKVPVDAGALREVLLAFQGHSHQVNELMATRDKPPILTGNPIDRLIREFNEWATEYDEENKCK